MFDENNEEDIFEACCSPLYESEEETTFDFIQKVKNKHVDTDKSNDIHSSICFLVCRFCDMFLFQNKNTLKNYNTPPFFQFKKIQKNQKMRNKRNKIMFKKNKMFQNYRLKKYKYHFSNKHVQNKKQKKIQPFQKTKIT